MFGCNWVERWAGPFTFFTCALTGSEYFLQLKQAFGVGFRHTLFLHDAGVSRFFVDSVDFERFGYAQARKVGRDRVYARRMLAILKRRTDRVTLVMRQLRGRIPTSDQYQRLIRELDAYLPYHCFLKKTVEFLPTHVLDRVLPSFVAARGYSEHVYSRTETLLKALAQRICRREKLDWDSHLLTCMTPSELGAYLEHRVLPPERTLRRRWENTVLYFRNGACVMLHGRDALAVRKRLLPGSPPRLRSIKADVACGGAARGICRIILDPHAVRAFHDGDVLVTGMTRPEFEPLMQRASAIITDVGGILCHAAIRSRELNIPCLVGAGIATRVLRDGDLVSVDADKGLVRLLRRSDDAYAASH